MSKVIHLLKGDMLVDDDFVPPKGHIQIDRSGYAQVQIYIRKINGVRKMKIVTVHRLVIGAQRGQMVDHINTNRLDNRLVNLRFCTAQQNSSHMRAKGWTLIKSNGKYLAQIRYNGRNVHLGEYNTKEDAAGKYFAASKLLYGDFASVRDDSRKGRSHAS